MELKIREFLIKNHPDKENNNEEEIKQETKRTWNFARRVVQLLHN